MENLERYAYLWDGSEPGWILQFIDRQEVSLSLSFKSGAPSLHEMRAVRLAVPAYQAMSASGAVAELRGKAKIHLGEFEPRDAHEIAEACRMQGLTVHEYGCDKSGYLLCNERTHVCLLIEDNCLAEAVTKEALRNGVPVRNLTA